MIYSLQTLSLRLRFLTVVLLFFPVLGAEWLVTSAPWSLAKLNLLSHGAGLPDTRFWYGFDQLSSLYQAWGPEGKLTYWTVIWPSDTLFLLTYGLFLFAAILYLLKRARPQGLWWFALPLVPVAAAIADFLENGFVAWGALVGSSGLEILAPLASTLTALKWTLLGISGVILIGGILVHWLKTFRQRVLPESRRRGYSEGARGGPHGRQIQAEEGSQEGSRQISRRETEGKGGQKSEPS